jgi:DNA-binding transcriptional MocR family regulator
MSETTKATSTTDTVARALTDHPDGITTRALAKATGLAQTTVQKALTAMETAGTATRTPGESNGSRRTGDTWRPATATADEAPVADDATATPDEAPVADDATATRTRRRWPTTPRRPPTRRRHRPRRVSLT